MAREADVKKKKRSMGSFLLRLAICVAAVYLVATFVNGQLRLAEKRRELAELDAKVALQIEENQELQRMMDQDDEDAYVERMAREKLGYARRQERVFIDLTGE